MGLGNRIAIRWSSLGLGLVVLFQNCETPYTLKLTNPEELARTNLPIVEAAQVFKATTIQITEGAGAQKITLPLREPAASDLKIAWTVSPSLWGPAAPDTFPAQGISSISEGGSSFEFELAAIEDSIYEGLEELTIDLVTTSVATGNSYRSEIKLNIADSLPPPEISFYTDPQRTQPVDISSPILVAEANSADLYIGVCSTCAPSGRPILFRLKPIFTEALEGQSLPPGAASPEDVGFGDFDFETSRSIIPAGATHTLISFTAINDQVFESEIESFELQILPANENVQAGANALIQIAERKEPPKIKLSASPQVINEGESTNIELEIENAHTLEISHELKIRLGLSYYDKTENSQMITAITTPGIIHSEFVPASPATAGLTDLDVSAFPENRTSLPEISVKRTGDTTITATYKIGGNTVDTDFSINALGFVPDSGEKLPKLSFPVTAVLDPDDFEDDERFYALAKSSWHFEEIENGTSVVREINDTTLHSVPITINNQLNPISITTTKNKSLLEEPEPPAEGPSPPAKTWVNVLTISALGRAIEESPLTWQLTNQAVTASDCSSPEHSLITDMHQVLKDNSNSYYSSLILHLLPNDIDLAKAFQADPEDFDLRIQKRIALAHNQYSEWADVVAGDSQLSSTFRTRSEQIALPIDSVSEFRVEMAVNSDLIAEYHECFTIESKVEPTDPQAPISGLPNPEQLKLFIKDRDHSPIPQLSIVNLPAMLMPPTISTEPSFPDDPEDNEGQPATTDFSNSQLQRAPIDINEGQEHIIKLKLLGGGERFYFTKASLTTAPESGVKQIPWVRVRDNNDINLIKEFTKYWDPMLIDFILVADESDFGWVTPPATGKVAEAPNERILIWPPATTTQTLTLKAFDDNDDNRNEGFYLNLGAVLTTDPVIMIDNQNSHQQPEAANSPPEPMSAPAALSTVVRIIDDAEVPKPPPPPDDDQVEDGATTQNDNEQHDQASDASDITITN